MEAVKFEIADSILTCTFAATVPAGEGTLSIDFSGPLCDALKGLYEFYTGFVIFYIFTSCHELFNCLVMMGNELERLHNLKRLARDSVFLVGMNRLSRQLLTFR